MVSHNLHSHNVTFLGYFLYSQPYCQVRQKLGLVPRHPAFLKCQRIINKAATWDWLFEHRSVNREVGLGSHSPSHSSPIPNKPYSFCGRKAPWKKRRKDWLVQEADSNVTCIRLSSTTGPCCLSLTIVACTTFLNAASCTHIPHIYTYTQSHTHTHACTHAHTTHICPHTHTHAHTHIHHTYLHNSHITLDTHIMHGTNYTSTLSLLLSPYFCIVLFVAMFF